MRIKYKMGDKVKFGFAFGKKITGIKNDINFNYIETVNKGVCPHCGKTLSQAKTYKIICVIEIDNGKFYMGYSEDKKILRLPEDQLAGLFKNLK